jgi:hypothetical protein
MEEVLCPLCGKPNPPENKFCDFCLAHLKPVEHTVTGEPKYESIDEGITSDSKDKESGSYVPEWLQRQQQLEQEKRDGQVEPLSASDKAPESVPDWITGISKDEEEEYQDQDEGLSNLEKLDQEPISRVEPFLPGQDVPSSQEIPDWLGEALIEVEDEDRGGLGFRPEPGQEESDRTVPLVESPQTELFREPEGDLQSTGPLAGLKGVLSAQPAVARARKSAEYSAKLRLTANQRAHVDLLKSLVEQEDQIQPLPQRGAISRQHVFRWTVGLVLFLSVLWPLVINSQELPFPENEEGSAEVHRLVSQLPENASIMVGIDFEPGLSGELDAVALPVMEHLIQKGAFLTLVSTSPQGPVLAERLMQSAQADVEDTGGFQYLNLGYIPGGAAGLLSFIENPQRTMPFSLEGENAWEADSEPTLKDINKITDYSMVILLVDDPDKARIWIEQLGPRINDLDVLTSFVLLTSAQLEAMVMPYYESTPRMVNGMVVGLRGGAAYARITGMGDLPRKYWDAFGVGTSIAALLILIGGMGYYVIPELTRSPQARREG